MSDWPDGHSQATALIRELMYEQRLNQSDLAKQCGYTRGSMSQLLNGNPRRNMTMKTCEHILTTLGQDLVICCKPKETR